MLRTDNPARRVSGRVIILSAIAVVLPLTASRAIEYVDVVAPAAPSFPAVHEAAAVKPATVAAVTPAPVPAALPVAAAAVIKPSDDVSIDDEWITIDGTRKHWEELTPTEKARVRSAVANARAALERTHIDRAKIMRDVAAATKNINMEELRANIARSQAGAAEAMRGIDASAAYIRASGQDPEQVKESVRRALESARAIDVDAIQRAVSAIDQRQIAQSLDGAEESMRKARADLARIEARMRADQRP